ncbi:GT-D fold domain-containing glycosyltransferase [Brevibacterium sp. NPDC059310]|uniref:GT-D fold domain-containing glycosyltransferase n=1 Tax=Brevibacterium sp. NPDC059310 TaxID=3346802 RepID=UPI00366D2291
MDQELGKIRWEAKTARLNQEVLRNLASGPLYEDMAKCIGKRQLSLEATVRHIANTGASFSRFGDGELMTIFRPDYRLSFQKRSEALVDSLLNVFSFGSNNLLIGFPNLYRDLHWTKIWSDIWVDVKPLFEPLGVIGNSHASRPLFFSATGQAGVDLWRTVWEGKHVAVVTGEGSRFTAVPALFDNVPKLDLIQSTSVDAYESLETVKAECLNHSADIFLISLGPAATILSSELSKEGRQAIDVGHLASSFENVFSGGEWPEAKAVSGT